MVKAKGQIKASAAHKIFVQILMVLLLAGTAFPQEYAVNTYDENSPGYPKQIKTVFVDLESKSIIESVIIGTQGQIINKKPLFIIRQSDTLLITAVMEGCYCDNAIVGKNIARITVIDRVTRQIVHSYPDSNLFIDTFGQLKNKRVYMSAETLSDPRENLDGDYKLGNNYEFVMETPSPPHYSYGLYEGIGQFDFLEPVDQTNDIYMASYLSQRYILKTNSAGNQIVDSLLLTNIPFRSQFFAVKDNLLYAFNHNYEIYTETTQKTRNEDWIDSHVMIYDISDFSPVDSITIQDYPEGDYVDGAFDRADIVEDYIVYYFFGREGLTRFAPAMLFIFDTRTNEASWLRVGWR